MGETMMNEAFFDTLTTKELENIVGIIGRVLEKRSLELFREINQANLRSIYKDYEN